MRRLQAALPVCFPALSANRARSWSRVQKGCLACCSETPVVIGLVNIFVPFMVLPIMASIERISPSLEEAAQNLGASWYRMFGRGILPLSLPGLISGCLLVYSLSISAFVLVRFADTVAVVRRARAFGGS